MAQFLAMLMDFLPEALALGAVFGHDRRLGVLLAAFIGAQNLPEGFNSFLSPERKEIVSRPVPWIRRGVPEASGSPRP